MSPRHAAGAVACPDHQVLSDFNLGKLSEDELDDVAMHISSCPRCEALLVRLDTSAERDSLVDRLKGCMEGPPLPDDPAYQAMVAIAENIAVRPFWFDRTTAGDEGATERPERELDIQSAPTLIGPYQVLSTIGRGGMGVVYEARQLPLNRIVAVKMILAGAHAGSSAIARFTREGKAIARICHPNIVQVYDFGVCDGLPYYSMELVKGETLQARLTRGVMPPKEAAGLVQTLAMAVDAAHLQRVVHLDLKPANVLIGPDGTPKIVDFGLARFVDDDPHANGTSLASELTSVAGTPCYMAPEQVEGRRAELGPATDVYALGAILYELLTGRPPLVGRTKTRTLQLVLSAVPAAPSTKRSGIPAWLEQICLRALSKAPSKRYASAKELAEDLGRWLRNERPEGIPSPLALALHRLRRGAVPVLIGGIIASIGATTYWKNPPRDATRLQNALAAGAPVALVKAKGIPEWHRWVMGETKSVMSLSDDRTVQVSSWALGMVEILPGTNRDRYRVRAEVRHESAALLSEVGLYVAHTSHLTENGKSVHSFIQMTFDLVRAKGGTGVPLAADGTVPLPRPKGNTVNVFPHLCTDLALRPYYERRLQGAFSIPFAALGNHNGRWNNLELTVTPEAITAIWNDKRVLLTSERIRTAMADVVNLGYTPEPFSDPEELRKLPDIRGGLGIYVHSGSASFRNISITPL